MVDIWLCDVEFEESPIPPTTMRRLDEVTIRNDGCVWRIYKNDADPFPSKPHAHNLELGLKLDLSNGMLFFGSNPTGKRLKEKDFDFIRKRLMILGIE